MVRLFFISLTLSLIPFKAANATNKKSNQERVIHVCKRGDSPSKALACNMVLEAGGEGKLGMLAVGFVTINRKKDSTKFPNTVAEVVYQEKQFSWTIKGHKKVKDRVVWESANEISNMLEMLQKFPPLYRAIDPTHGATYYHRSTIRPHWSKCFIKTSGIKNHIFYKRSTR